MAMARAVPRSPLDARTSTTPGKSPGNMIIAFSLMSGKLVIDD
jgi:hypothetical protein